MAQPLGKFIVGSWRPIQSRHETKCRQDGRPHQSTECADRSRGLNIYDDNLVGIDQVIRRIGKEGSAFGGLDQTGICRRPLAANETVHNATRHSRLE